MLDIAIVGMGPAGMSAAINAKARNKSVKIFGSGIESSNLYKAEKINNYLGLSNLTGKELLEDFKKHIEDLGIEFEEKKVIEIFNMNGSFSLNVSNEFISAKNVIIATGIPKVKGFNNESEFLGKGVSYCATCDGMLYRNKDVAIYLENPKEEVDALFLTEICNKVYVITRYENIENEDLKNKANVIKCESNKVKSIIGDKKVTALELENESINIEGFFIMRESTILSNLIKGLEIVDNHIKVNSDFETNIPGLYAIGDVIGKPYQVSKAAADGQVCALRIAEKI